MTCTLKYEHFSAVEVAPDGTSEGPPTFGVEILGSLDIAFALYLRWT